MFSGIATGTLDAMGVCTGEDVAGAPVSYNNVEINNKYAPIMSNGCSYSNVGSANV